jgi:hypothetical protein
LSDVGKLQRPEAATAMDAGELGAHEGAAALEDPSVARARAGGELEFRASGGARGVAPMQRLMDERRAVGGRLATRVQRKGDGAAAGNVAIPESGGAKLPSSVRAKMEPKLGADLSDVNVHTGGASAQAASGLGARAFTVGHDVHFNAGEFAPGSKEGDRLLAHELTHVVQGKKSGVQRKPQEEGAAATSAASGERQHDGGEQAGVDHAGEVSHPDEPAEKEADAVADGVADSLHGGDKKDKHHGKGKHHGKDKKDKHDDKHGAEEHEPAPGGGGEPTGERMHKPIAMETQGAQPAGGEHAAGEAQGGSPQEKPAAISAKLIGVGRKIFRTKGGSAAPSQKGGDKAADPKQAGIDKAKACNTPADVDAFCAADPIATQKLQDVKTESNLEGGAGASKNARDGFYTKLATWIRTNAETVNPKTIFNQCMNSLAGEWKFKGKKLDAKTLPKAMQRTQGLKGFWYTAVDKNHYKGRAAGAPDVDKMAYDLWKQDAKTNPLMHVDASGVISPEGGTWFTPDSYKLTNAGDAGYGQLLELAALQPEWFPEGNIAFEVDVAAAASKMEARKPTAYDGMQSVLWVSRPTGEDYGVTGGGALEFLGGKVPVPAIKNARAVIPSADTQQQLADAIKAARDQSLAADPILKQKIDSATDPKVKKSYEEMIPNLTDMFIRGTATVPLGASVKQMLDAIKNSTSGERANPSAPRAAGEITAPSAGGSKPPPTSAAGGTTPSPGPKKK